MVPSIPAKILVGISLDANVCNEILSWVIGVAAHPYDTVVALHILGKESSKKHESKKFNKTKFRQAKTFVISMLGDFAKICQFKQVNLEARVGTSSSIGKGLIDEAASIGAAFLVVGGSRNQNRSKRSSHEITKYCFKHAPKGCSVVSIGINGQRLQDSESGLLPLEGFDQSSLRRPNKDIHVSKAMSYPQKPFVLEKKKQNSFNKSKNQCDQYSPSQSPREKPSPRPVLDEPEGESCRIEEDCSSLGDSSIIESPPQTCKLEGRSKIWKHLSTIKLLFPLFRSSFDGTERKRNDSFCDKDNHQPLWRCFSYEEVSNATNDFHPANMVGRGGFADVYRGDLYDGQTIAVKRLAKDNTNENKQKEFLMELGIIGHVCHPNTAYLIGCCIENGLYLIFKFSPNGNLASALHGRPCKLLDWPVRYKIAIGIASGLHYLHKCCKRRIIHRDIKASNVLLGPNFEPQISDFGLSKWLPNQWTHHSVIPIEGTFGYLAPEYFMHGIVDEKTDVFAFGVLLLEIITGRRPVDSSKKNLLFWAKPLIESGEITQLADPKLGGKYDMDQMRRLVLTASYCVRQSSLWRPSMSEVLQLLTDGHNSEVAQSWKMPECMVDEMDDYTVDFDSRFRTNQIFQDYLNM